MGRTNEWITRCSMRPSDMRCPSSAGVAWHTGCLGPNQSIDGSSEAVIAVADRSTGPLAWRLCFASAACLPSFGFQHYSGLGLITSVWRRHASPNHGCGTQWRCSSAACLPAHHLDRAQSQLNRGRGLQPCSRDAPSNTIQVLSSHHRSSSSAVGCSLTHPHTSQQPPLHTQSKQPPCPQPPPPPPSSVSPEAS